ncbi:thermonuclease family protein [Cohaesibacter sp. ES.047]|uniref:thermonuclease family protein n=1 Tax=Cohaesibacter sp. ES.047 TaxID=1798205 RepID=UPI0015611D65|nr:thermonuclease family protein [Cohaesibacter sp. ES.047]
MSIALWLALSLSAHAEDATNGRALNPCLQDTQDTQAIGLALDQTSLHKLTSENGQTFILSGLLVETLIPPALEEKRMARILALLEQSDATLKLLADPSAKADRYGRLPVFVLRGEPSGEQSAAADTVQEHLIRAGLARVDPALLSSACARHLLTLEQRARDKHTGLWKEETYRAKDANHLHLSAIVSTYQLIKGTVRSVSRRPETTSYLNFGHYWKKDFTVTLSKKSLAAWERENKSLDELDKAHIYVRGWIEDRGGPLIRINHPWQLQQRP